MILVSIFVTILWICSISLIVINLWFCSSSLLIFVNLFYIFVAILLTCSTYLLIFCVLVQRNESACGWDIEPYKFPLIIILTGPMRCVSRNVFVRLDMLYFRRQSSLRYFILLIVRSQYSNIFRKVVFLLIVLCIIFTAFSNVMRFASPFRSFSTLHYRSDGMTGYCFLKSGWVSSQASLCTEREQTFVQKIIYN